MSQIERIFKVKESLLKDVGRAIARIDPKDMAEAGIGVGDIVLAEGKRATPVKVLPCYPEDRGKGIIQIDGITRENAQTGIDEKVKVTAIASKKAAKVVLKPVDGGASSIRGDDAKYIGSLISGLPVMKGDRVKATLFGSRSVHYTVNATAPAGVVLIHPDTSIALELPKKSEGGVNLVTYEDIGGLGTQVQRIREMIELPLKYPEIFDRLGVEPPKGVFLYGPPGTGKTLIVRAVARETDAYFINISGPEIMGKFYGESEARIRNIFAEAEAHAPSIIFIDEIDAIAPRREDMGGEKQVEKRVVAQLLSLMDGLKSRGKVIVIGATNIPNAIDPALRRPGRFDREISVSVPDRNGRLEIIHIHTRGIPLSDDVDLGRIADITHGFVGADLEALAREAAMTALRRILPKIDFELSEIPYELLTQLEVTMENFLDAMKEVEPSAIREFFVEVPNVRWEDVGGHEEVKQALREAVEWPVRYRELFRKTGTTPPKGVILYGKPGTGKTWLAKALATESGVNFISVKGPEIISRFIGESEKAVRELFRLAKQSAPTIIFLDEIDSLAPARGAGGSESSVTQRVISQFLTEMDGIEELKGVFVLAATNRIDLLDPALIRPGRFDLLYEVPPPDVLARVRIFEIHTKSMTLDDDVSISALAESTEGMSGADIEFICRKASMGAISACIALEAGGIDPLHVELRVRDSHFQEAVRLLSSRYRDNGE
ncbi:AAA family ATPase [Chlorobium phaeovibrioides]|uniref:AAA family ATPase n=2 Tax=Chlorobium phaeovibrioides TaxID=1094 RepID=A0A3S0L4V8_CHLPH|nr:CDC48 family AAA ATPase [Chlorobium phaeovibrioides]KAA6232433.1 CDC48 family AAA ATPase [Chlorobium phaeovibrioides]MDT9546668.1 CDC48 family AAA ATPase [Chlorobium phaeovibrioides]RTY35986.1 AAA family ATPase [Chlorobium phaeovibrioides]RTY37262.1 AAA family ATPase [Chlorobium phaeovibrioides]